MLDSEETHPEPPSLFARKPGHSLLIGSLLLVSGLLLGSYAYLTLYAAFTGQTLQALRDFGIDPETSWEINVFRTLQMVVTLFAFCLPAYFWAATENGSPFLLLRMKARPRIVLVLLACFGMIVSLPFIDFVQLSPESLRLPDFLYELQKSIVETEKKSTETIMLLLANPSFGVFLLNVLVVSIAPALAEEMFFRGFLLRSFRRFSNIHVSVWASAFLFSFIHFQFLGFVSRLLLGAMLGYFFIYSGNLWVSIAAHFANNFFNVLLAWLASLGVFGDLDLEAKFGFPIWLSLISLGLALGFTFLFVRLSPNAIPPDLPAEPLKSNE